MIHTLTGNLLAERAFDFPGGWRRGGTNRAASAAFQVGGKGVNVSKMLLRLGARTRAIVLAGGRDGQAAADWLRARKIPAVLLPTTTPTRAGLVVRSPAGETTFLGPDAAPDPGALRRLAALVDKLPRGQPLAVCGSLPGWGQAAAKPLRDALARAAKTRPLVADTYGPPLAGLVRLPLELVKINRSEFDRLVPPGAPAVRLPARLRRAARAFPVRNWIVTDGPRPVWLLEHGRAPRKFLPEKIREVSPTGSGDVLLAVLLHARFNGNKTLATALAEALPFAAANAAHPGVAEFELPAVRVPARLPRKHLQPNPTAP